MKRFALRFAALFSFALLLVFTACDSSRSGEVGALEPEIDSIFRAFNGPDLPGAAVAVWKDGQLAFSKGYGSANLEYDIPVTPDETIFHVASVSKQFTVFAIMLLEAEGKLSLEPLR